MRCLVIRGEDEVLRFPVPEVEARLGSDPSNELVVPIAGVSRFHARLVPDSIALRLFDLDSKNGLLVKGKRCREAILLPGVEVQLGAARISLDEGATSDLDIAVQFPVVRSAVPRLSGQDCAVTETVTSSPVSAGAISFIRDLERFDEAGRSRPDSEEILERLLRLLAARTVSLLRQGIAGYEVVLSSGEPPGEAVLSTLRPGEDSARRLRLLDLEGLAGVWAPPVAPGGLACLVLLPPGAGLAPWQSEILSFGLEHFTDSGTLLARQLAAPIKRRPRLVYPEGMVPGSSPAMRGLLRQIEKTVSSRVDVLVLGETGTGKELIARMIHASGPTPNGPFVAINCAAIPSELLESELFGVRARVATGVDAQPGRILGADGGTLLLDEIGDMPSSLQPKLLRFLQEREVHSVGAPRPEKVSLRVVSTSNRDLPADVKAGSFRADLYYRLRGLQFHVPPLRERKDDLAGLVAAFASRAAAEERKEVRGLSRKALELLRAYDWPGNVRELRSEVNRAVLFCTAGSSLTSEHFKTVEWAVRNRAGENSPPSHSSVSANAAVSPTPEVSLNLRENVDRLEKRLIQSALEKAGGNKSRAAELLGVTRPGLGMKIRRLLNSLADKH